MSQALKKNILIVVAALGGAILIAIVAVTGLAAYFKRSNLTPLAEPPAHGASFIIEAEVLEASQATNSLDGLKNVLLKRADKVGLRICWEPISGSQVRVLADTRNQISAQQLQGSFFRTGQLEFRLVHEDSARLIEAGEIPPGYEILRQEQDTPSGGRRTEQLVVKKKSESGLSGNVIKRAMVTRGNLGEPEINFTFQPEATEAFARVTRENVGRRLAIVMDGQLYSAPSIQSPIETGSGTITGDFDRSEAFEIANGLEHPLPIAVKVVEAKEY